MPDDLLRRFREKIRSRSAGRARDEIAGPAGQSGRASSAGPAGDAGLPGDIELPVDAGLPGDTGLPGEVALAAAMNAPPDAGVSELAILEAGVGPFAEADRLHPLFVPGMPRVRVTLEIGSVLRRRAASLSVRQLDRLLEICPSLSRHSCGAGDPLQALRRRLDPSGAGAYLPNPAGSAPAASPGAGPDDGVVIAHLIEHVAIDLTVRAAGGGRCSGVTCAWRDRLDRFDLFLEASDPALARATVLLAAALVRDLCGGRGGLDDYRRGRDLLTALTARGLRDTAPEDVCEALGWALDEALATLRMLVRFGYLETVAAPFTFSSPTGMIFRPAPAGPPIDWQQIFPDGPAV